jgi:DNA-binding NtrC family response regulator
MMRRQPVHVVISDIRMPEMDGLDLLRLIKRDYPAVDVIMISGHGDIDDAIEALRRGAFDYLRKPFDMEELSITVQRSYAKQQKDRRFREMQNQFYHAQKMESLGTLAGGVAHEFNNLMSGILGYSTMALESDDTDIYRKALDVSCKASRRAAEIASNLLRFAQRNASAPLHCDVNDILRETLLLVQTDLENDKITIRTDFGEMQPIQVDVGEFQQVFLNLLINVRQALKDSSRTPKLLTISTSCDKETVRIEIADNGPGIPEDLRQKVFEPFFTTRGVLSGGATKTASGLGLSVADGIIRRHSGSIKAQETPGGGATIVLELPVAKEEKTRETRILLCDDEKNVRRIMRVILEKKGFIIDEATNGEEALEKIKSARFDLMLLDQLMPGISGLEVLRQAAEIVPDMPVIMVTGLAQHKLAHEAIMAGAKECVFKPVNTPKLIFLAEKYAGAAGTTVEKSPAGKFDPSGKSILILDENVIMRDVYQLVLGREGFSTTTVSTAADAIRKTTEHYYDLILLDIIIPDMDGPIAISSLRANNPYTPIIISTGHPGREEVKAGLLAGASRVIQKPLNPNLLVEEVMNLILLYQERGAENTDNG